MFNIVKGTHDIILDEANMYTYVENLLIKVSETYGFNEFRTPILEYTDLFQRSSGDSSDVVRKEMYTFLDKANRSITLRPEITAGTIRCMVNEKIFANQDYPVKAYYLGPNFRYERPQKGRYRQFNQFGVESVGVNHYLRDCEIISLGYNCLKLLGFKNVKLKINSLGDKETRLKYQNALKEYFSNYLEEMCEDCKDRFNLNILRILDCKVPNDIKIVDNAPKISDFYSDSSKKEFDNILNFLKENNINYEIDNNLVRGLDYYSGVVFEYDFTSKNGNNLGALGGGGHYNNLVKDIGGPDIEGCGFAFGIERLVSLMKEEELFNNLDVISKLDCYLMPIGDGNIEYSYKILNYLRLNGFSSEICLEKKSFGAMFKKAERKKAKYALIIGDEERDNETVKLKCLKCQTQEIIKLENLIDVLDEKLDNEECECHCH